MPTIELLAEVQVWRERAEKAEAERDRLQAFVVKVSQQRIPRPDYWSDCGQCDRNIEDAKELLEDKP